MSTAEEVSDAAAAVAAALAAAAQDPADALRLLQDLARVALPGVVGASLIAQAMTTMQAAMGDLLRRTAVIAMAQASALYQPSSNDDATRVLQMVTAMLDAEIVVAGDQGEDDVYAALWDLRSAVVADLGARGADLAPIAEFAFKANLPAVALAQRLYQDPTREAELVTQVDPVHPLFMPVAFTALAQ
jgi:prophage DNA circulation protein